VVNQKQWRFIRDLPLETVNHETTANGIWRLL